MMYKVEGHGDLARDPKTNAVVNVNSFDHQKYVSTRDIKKAKEEDLDLMKEDLDSLKGEIGEIKSLLRELVHGK
jgi:hypothetical protein